MKFTKELKTIIVIPETASPTEKFAAEELKKYLNKIFACDAEITADYSAKADNIIAIGGPEKNALTASLISEDELIGRAHV